jgi:hypothetical protein
MSDSDDTRSSPDMRRLYALAIACEVVVIAALWAVKHLFS